MRRLRFALAFAALVITLPAHAQEDTDALNGKIDQLEREITILQKQVYRGGTMATGEAGAALPAGGQLEVRLSQIDEQIRELRGSIEQVQFANRQTNTDLKKLSDDMEYRLHALETKPVAAAPVVEPAAIAADIAPVEPAHFDPNQKPGDEKKPAPKAALTGNDFPDANAHYSYAFKLLNDKKYAEAASSFDVFVKKYPSDPLTANAYYWLGESYYARTDYTRAAESFRKGFEANPEGQKAPDNLFKLGKSLLQVKRVNEACIVFDQITKKYADSAPRVVKLAGDERLAVPCK